MRRSVAKVAPPSHPVSGTAYDDRKSPTSAADTNPLLWPLQDETTQRFNLNDDSTPVQSVADLNLPQMTPVSLQRDDGPPEMVCEGEPLFFFLFDIFLGLELDCTALNWSLCFIM